MLFLYAGAHKISFNLYFLKTQLNEWFTFRREQLQSVYVRMNEQQVQGHNKEMCWKCAKIMK